MKKFFTVIISAVLLTALILPVSATDESVSDINALTSGEILNTQPVLTVNTAGNVEVAAKASLLMDSNTGTLLLAQNEHQKLYPASVTKIMTLILACEALETGKMSYDEVITCSETAAAKGGSQIWLEAGETMTVRELMKAAVVYSANDACALLAEVIAGSEESFVALMNEKAASLGMNDTHFDNCTGLDDDTTTHLTSAYDIALMSRVLIKKDMIKEFTTIWMDELRNGETQLVNTNKLIRNYSGANGLKTGTTSKAGCCISATAERDGLELIAVILGADNSKNRFNGARALLDFGFANYEVYTPQPDLSGHSEIKVTRGVERSVELKSVSSGQLLINKGAAADIKQQCEIAEEIEAPVAEGQKVGKTIFTSNGTVIAEYDIVCATQVDKMTFLSALSLILKSPSMINN